MTSKFRRIQQNYFMYNLMILERLMGTRTLKEKEIEGSDRKFLFMFPFAEFCLQNQLLSGVKLTNIKVRGLNKENNKVPFKCSTLFIQISLKFCFEGNGLWKEEERARIFISV